MLKITTIIIIVTNIFNIKSSIYFEEIARTNKQGIGQVFQELLLLDVQGQTNRNNNKTNQLTNIKSTNSTNNIEHFYRHITQKYTQVHLEVL